MRGGEFFAMLGDGAWDSRGKSGTQGPAVDGLLVVVFESPQGGRGPKQR